VVVYLSIVEPGVVVVSVTSAAVTFKVIAPATQLLPSLEVQFAVLAESVSVRILYQLFVSKIAEQPRTPSAAVVPNFSFENVTLVE